MNQSPLPQESEGIALPIIQSEIEFEMNHLRQSLRSIMFCKVVIRYVFSLKWVALLLVCGGLTETTAWGQAKNESSAPVLQGVKSKTTVKSLTEEEREWLRNHPVIRVAQDPDWPPLEFVNSQGEPSGISADYARIVEQRLGIKFEWVPNLSWQEAYARMRRWDIDMATCVAVTPERTNFWAFTKPYIKVPIVILTRKDVTYIHTMTELAGKKVATVEGYAASEWMTRDFPDIQQVRVKTLKEAVAKVQKGEAFAVIDNMMAIGVHLAKQGSANLKVSGETPYFYAQGMAVRKDWAIFAGILQKALDTISDAERAVIYAKWIPIQYEDPHKYRLFWQALFVFILILSVLVFWNQKLSREIRHRKETEAALRESEERLRLLGDNLPNGMVYQTVREADGRRRFVYVSSGVERLTGVSAEEVLKNPRILYDQLLPEDRKRLEEAQEIAYRNFSVLCVEVRQRSATGELKWMQLCSAPRRLPDGRVAWDGIQMDITERKRAEEALRQSEATLRSLFLAAPVGICILKDRIFQSANKCWCETYGYPEESVLGKDTRMLYESEEEFVRVGQATHACLQAKRVSFIESKHVCSDGSLRNVILTVALVRQDDPSAGTVVIAHDVTELRKVERDLRLLNTELEERVQVRTAQLEASNKELEAFSYSVSHDLRSPLRGIDGWSQLLLEDYGSQLNAEGRGYIERVRSETQRMGNLIDSMLKMAQVARAEMHPVPVDLSTLAQTIATRTQGLYPNCKIEFGIQPRVVVHGDPRLLEIVLTNLVENACKFSSKRAQARVEFGKLENTPDPNGQLSIVYFVRDNGAGFDAAYAQKIFGVFQRLHKASEFPGTGIGLATVQRIVKRHGGQIWAQAQVNEGATFFFTLPNPPSPFKVLQVGKLVL